MSQRYYAQITPGLESLLSDELKGLGVRRRSMSRGGVSFEGTKKHLYRALLWSRLASRVWLTLTEGPAPNPHALFQRAVKVPWLQYLSPQHRLAVKAVLHRSSLAGSGQTESVVWSALRASLAHAGMSPPQEGGWGDDDTTQRILVYVEGGRFQLRLDGAGALLHVRGWRSADGPAPLRPTIASACLSALKWRPGEPLIDPMCGSGTLTIEALSYAYKTLPRARESYACMSWPQFDSKLWETSLALNHNTPPVSATPLRHWMGDQAQPTLSLAQRHVNSQRYVGDAKVVYAQRDATQLSWTELCELWVGSPPPETGLVLVNPPYGKRVDDQGLQEPTEREQSVAQRFILRLPELVGSGGVGWRAGVLFPSAYPLSPPTGWSMRVTLQFSHGGIPVTLWQLEPTRA